MIIRTDEEKDVLIAELSSALIDVCDGESQFDLRDNTGLEVKRCCEILELTQRCINEADCG